MELNRLFKDVPACLIYGNENLTISGISAHSKSILPGWLFIAKKGLSFDGGNYAREAISNGAAALLSASYDPLLPYVTQIVHPNPAAIESILASNFYNDPSSHLFLTAITGTSGKTTTSFLIKYLLDTFHGPCGLIGSIENWIGSRRIEATHTTPDVITNHQFLAEMVKEKCQSAVMEVTSHALVQGRVDKIDFDIAVFTNLTPEHLDYHENMQSYCQAKNRLFRDFGQIQGEKKGPKFAIVNLDDPWMKEVTNGCKAQRLTYGIDSEASLRASSIHFGKNGTEALITFKGETLPFFWPLCGRFNVYNSLAAIGVGLVSGISLKQLAEMFSKLPLVKGRLERIENPLNLDLFVDYSHKPDALKNVLATLSEFKKGRIITVFGCGGDRDREKRPVMGSIAENFSALTIVTTDNPRSEDPAAIAQEIIKGFTRPDRYHVELDRRQAIRKAIEYSTKDDVVLIAGKGHETYQIFGQQKVEFDDSKIALEICSEIFLKRGS